MRAVPDLPSPRGDTTTALLAALARARRTSSRRSRSRPPRPARRRGPPPLAPPLLRAALPRLRRRRRRAGSGSRPCSPSARRSSSVRAPHSSRLGPVGPRRRRRTGSRRARAFEAPDDGRSLCRSYVAAPAPRSSRSRVRHPPLGVPAQGGRPAHVGDPAPRRRGQGGAGRDPGRRVRRRPTPSGCTPSCSPRRWRARARPRATAPTSTAPRGRRSPPSTSSRCSACTAGCAARCVGHLAAFEMTSLDPEPALRERAATARYRRRRPPGFFDEHVEADAVHEAIAAHDLAGGLARREPALGPDIIFGGRARWRSRARCARVRCWTRGPAPARRSPVGRRSALAASSAPLGALKRTSLCGHRRTAVGATAAAASATVARRLDRLAVLVEHPDRTRTSSGQSR